MNKLSQRKYLDSVIAKVRVDHEYYAGLSAAYQGHPKVGHVFLNMSEDLHQLHRSFAFQRKILDDELRSMGVCLCDDCNIHNLSIEDRREHFIDTLQQNRITKEMAHLMEN